MLERRGFLTTLLLLFSAPFALSSDRLANWRREWMRRGTLRRRYQGDGLVYPIIHPDGRIERVVIRQDDYKTWAYHYYHLPPNYQSPAGRFWKSWLERKSPR
jgi:hypothetical protein